MRFFLVNILKFIPFLFIVYFGLLIFSGELVPNYFLYNLNYNYTLGSYGGTQSRYNEIDKFEDLDIVFLGSSHCFRAFDTRIFEKEGYSSFNMGSPSQTVLQTEILLEQYIDKLDPKLVVIEVNPVTFHSDGIESSLDIIPNVGLSWPLTKLAFRQNHISVYNTLLYAVYYEMIHGKSKKINYNHIKGERDQYISGGFSQKDLMFNKGKKRKNKNCEPNPQQIVALKNIVKNHDNQQIILVQSPITSEYYNSINDRVEFDELIKSFNVPYYNFNLLMELDDSLHFYDHHHLNQNGVDVYNKAFIKILQDDQILKSHINNSEGL